MHLSNLQTSVPCNLVRMDSEVRLANISSPTDHLLNIQAHQSHFSISSPPESLWLVINHIGRHRLQVGDILKLGRVQARVKELCGGEDIESLNTFESFDDEIPD